MAADPSGPALAAVAPSALRNTPTLRSMKIGVQLPEVERFVPWPEYRAMALAAEAGGLDSLWIGDHLLYDLPDGSVRGPWECWSTLAALAEATTTIELAPLVASTGFHEPAMLAKKAATVDAISGGRLTVALGSGWNEREYDAFGFAFDKRVSRFEEAFTIIRRLLREGRCDFDGVYHRAVDCVLDPPARSDISIMIGSSGPRMLSITMPHVDAWNIWFDDFDNNPSELPARISEIDQAAAAAGRDGADIAKTAALLVQLSDSPERRNSRNPILGPDALVDALNEMQSIGIDHVQLVLDPITIETVHAAAAAVQTTR